MNPTFITLSRKIPALLFLCFFLFVNLNAHAQKAKGAVAGSSGGGSGAKTSASTSSGGSYVSGFSYKLPRNYHIQYKAIKDTTIITKRISNPKGSYDYVLNTTNLSLKWTIPAKELNKNNPYRLDTVKLRFSVDFKNTEIKFDHFYYGYFTKTYQTHTPATSQPISYISGHDSVSTEATRLVTVDTIDRFYRVQSFWSDLNPLRVRRLRVSVTPSDSGKLLVVIKKHRDFKAHADVEKAQFVIYHPTEELSPAIPLSACDSARNFFLTVSRRNLINEYPRYLPLTYSIIQYGAVTIPFKYRFYNDRQIGGYTDKTRPFEKEVPAPGESTTSFNVAAYIGKKWGKTRFYYDAADTHNTVGLMVAAFAGPSVISLSANNVNYDTDMNATAPNQLALSTGAAFTLEWRTVNFGFFYGYDIPIERSPWVYRYKPWIGFGIGFSLGMFTNANALSQSSGN